MVRTIGQKGEGPGEFQNIGEIALLPDDRLLVLDWEAHRVSLFDTTGKFVDSHKFINWSYDIFDEDGVYSANVWLDILPGIFRNGKMYTRESDEETGYREYKRYRVIWSDQE
jgi:hypothetical protein